MFGYSYFILFFCFVFYLSLWLFKIASWLLTFESFQSMVLWSMVVYSFSPRRNDVLMMGPCKFGFLHILPQEVGNCQDMHASPLLSLFLLLSTPTNPTLCLQEEEFNLNGNGMKHLAHFSLLFQRNYYFFYFFRLFQNPGLRFHQNSRMATLLPL